MNKKSVFLFLSHKLTAEQKQDLEENWNVSGYVFLPEDLQEKWSNIPPDLQDLDEYLECFRIWLSKKAVKNDLVLISGDFGAVYKIVDYTESIGLTALYSSTKRTVEEMEISDGKICKESIFKHVLFRKYDR